MLAPDNTNCTINHTEYGANACISKHMNTKKCVVSAPKDHQSDIVVMSVVYILYCYFIVHVSSETFLVKCSAIFACKVGH